MSNKTNDILDEMKQDGHITSIDGNFVRPPLNKRFSWKWVKAHPREATFEEIWNLKPLKV